ncbi:MAG TPA: N-acetyl-gamma-glutamyl-phosphate reductase [Mycobacteriales bacterium]|nr:N-acetyl-gamma-glutamyl-phosphate reductase [Mycobacteriales bacterium]
MIRAAVAGGSGYIGGELLRLLLGHPQVELVATTSTRLAGRRVDGLHPNLRGLTGLAFVAPADLPDCDVLFLATGHGRSAAAMAGWSLRSKQVIDLSADFRLRDPARHAEFYGQPAAPDLVADFVYGLPELHRDRLRTADRVAAPGCMATAAILALHPLAAAGLVAGPVTVDARTGSSGSGAAAGPENLHAERSGALRVFAPLRHRHEAEIAQETGLAVRMTATGVEAVRGVQVVCRLTLPPGPGLEREVRRLYRAAYADEPFVRVVAARRGGYRLPEPKILAGSNFCDVGFAVDDATGDAVAVAALDNLVKGGAGNAVQSLNLRHGWPERTGLEFPGLHPV